MSKPYSPCYDCVPRCCRACSYSNLRTLYKNSVREKAELRKQKEKALLKAKLCDVIFTLKDDVPINFVILSNKNEVLQSVDRKKRDFVASLVYSAFMTEWVYSFELIGNWYNGYTAKIKVKLDGGGAHVDEVQS